MKGKASDKLASICAGLPLHEVDNFLDMARQVCWCNIFIGMGAAEALEVQQSPQVVHDLVAHLVGCTLDEVDALITQTREIVWSQTFADNQNTAYGRFVRDKDVNESAAFLASGARIN